MANNSVLTALRLLFGKSFPGIFVLLVAGVLASGFAQGAESTVEDTKTAGGLTVYLGVVPAEIVKGPASRSADQPMHGGTPIGMHEYHIVVAVYDSVSKLRVTDATVTAKVSGLGLAGPEKALEQMKVPGTFADSDNITYGAFFNLTPDLYTIRLSVQRPGKQPVIFELKYDHRRS
jgi:hypothetical protein